MDEKKNRSIFRKNIGRALLNKNNDEYLKIWELDTTSRKDKQLYGHLIDKAYQNQIEIEVSKIIQANFSFSVIEENDKDNRLLFEARLISEISKCDECRASMDWLGNFSTKDKIRESGLWQFNQLYKEGFNKGEFNNFKEKFCFDFQ